MAPILTVFTPAYNRADCLPRAYEALKRQTSKDFIWFVVDDGSTDNTRELVAGWLNADNGFEIRYFYKENGGMYTAYNLAIANIETELCVCVDSDDYLTDYAVEKILACWRKDGSNEYCGVIGLDCLENGEIIGDPFPDQKTINLLDMLAGKYKFKNGDRKNVLRTELYKELCPMEEFPGEKDFNPHYLHLEICKKYDYLVLNEKLCVVERLPDGMHNTVFRQYLRSPRSFRKMRLHAMTLPGLPKKRLAQDIIHYVSSCLISGEPCISASPYKLLTLLLYPAGILWTLYLYYYNWKTLKK